MNPLSGWFRGVGIAIKGPVQGPEKGRGISINQVTDGYFEARASACWRDDRSHPRSVGVAARRHSQRDRRPGDSSAPRVRWAES